MDNSEETLKKISDQLEKLDTKFNFLQDMLFTMRNELELIKKTTIRENYLTKITKVADKTLINFLDNRPKDCNILDFCTTLIEKEIFKILTTLLEKGEESALNEVNEFMKLSESDEVLKICPNNQCLINAIEPFKLLKDLILDSKELSLKYFEELTLTDQQSSFEELNEEELNDLLTPLSNAVRLKILNTLSKGGKNYSQLEEATGIKAGHLLFHIDKLKEVEYIIQENKKYLITMKGRKALNLISGLGKELSLKS
ncbi:MAG: ArsR family transcriptional regulator [Promethearchaeota archaeon]|nr:MAG: ArsR family transcriptional regulator [Candidatus Lokiarchaeota archaeon]